MVQYLACLILKSVFLTIKKEMIIMKFNQKLDLVVKRPYDENDQTLCFPTISLTKVIVLSIFTFGFYPLIMSYNYWKILNKNFAYDVSPFWRAIFFVYTNFKLFPILENYANAFNVRTFINFSVLAIIYLLQDAYFSPANKLFDNINDGPLLMLVFFIEIFVKVLGMSVFVYIQFIINKVNKENFPNAPKNKWSIANTIWSILVSISFCALLYLGVM